MIKQIFVLAGTSSLTYEIETNTPIPAAAASRAVVCIVLTTPVSTQRGAHPAEEVIYKTMHTFTEYLSNMLT